MALRSGMETLAAIEIVLSSMGRFEDVDSDIVLKYAVTFGLDLKTQPPKKFRHSVSAAVAFIDRNRQTGGAP